MTTTAFDDQFAPDPNSDTQWYFCEVCCEEYELIENYEGECPVCGHCEVKPL